MTFKEFIATRQHVDDIGVAIKMPEMFDGPQPGFVYDGCYWIADPCEALLDDYWTDIENGGTCGSLIECELDLYDWAARANGWPEVSGYQRACVINAAEQGVDVVIEELAKRGIEATLEQTGGFCMCWSVQFDGVHVQGTATGAAAFLTDECIPEEMITVISSNEWVVGSAGISGKVADDVANWMARRIAALFTTRLVAEIGGVNFLEVVRRNSTPEYAGCCASHDFCDANMTMLAAFRDAGLPEPGDSVADEMALWGRAWQAWLAMWRKGGAR